MVIHVEPHKFFHRDGELIYCELPISMTQAALGCTLDVPTIHGEKSLKIPHGTQPGHTFRLNGEGVPSLRGRGKGDMVVEVKVIIPSKMTKRQTELLEEFAEMESGDEEHHSEGFFKKLFSGNLGG